MVDEQKLQQAVQRIVAVAQPLRVILFDSYGRGDAGADSDLDLMVIKQQVDDRGEEMVRLRKAGGSREWGRRCSADWFRFDVHYAAWRSEDEWVWTQSASIARSCDCCKQWRIYDLG